MWAAARVAPECLQVLGDRRVSAGLIRVLTGGGLERCQRLIARAALSCIRSHQVKQAEVAVPDLITDRMGPRCICVLRERGRAPVGPGPCGIREVHRVRTTCAAHAVGRREKLAHVHPCGDQAQPILLTHDDLPSRRPQPRQHLTETLPGRVGGRVRKQKLEHGVDGKAVLMDGEDPHQLARHSGRQVERVTA